MKGLDTTCRLQLLNKQNTYSAQQLHTEDTPVYLHLKIHLLDAPVFRVQLAVLIFLWIEVNFSYD